MPPKQYTNAPSAKLSDYIDAARFRTVLHEQYEEPHGLSEVPVEIELSKEFAKKLSFHIPWDCWLYGFVRKNGLLSELDTASKINVVSLHDWDDKFLLLIDTKSGEKPFTVTGTEVRELLENCLRPPQQRPPVKYYE